MRGEPWHAAYMTLRRSYTRFAFLMNMKNSWATTKTIRVSYLDKQVLGTRRTLSNFFDLFYFATCLEEYESSSYFIVYVTPIIKARIVGELECAWTWKRVLRPDPVILDVQWEVLDAKTTKWCRGEIWQRQFRITLSPRNFYSLCAIQK